MISFEVVVDLIMPMVIMWIGIFLNMLIILVFSKRRFVQQFHPAVSMIVLAMNDIMALFAIVGNKQTYWTPQLNHLNTQTCKIFTFIYLVEHAFSAAFYISDRFDYCKWFHGLCRVGTIFLQLFYSHNIL